MVAVPRGNCLQPSAMQEEVKILARELAQPLTINCADQQAAERCLRRFGVLGKGSSPTEIVCQASSPELLTPNKMEFFSALLVA
ncbi:MAG: hypothetical protein HYZ92_01125 [Candidatus Omnitrophica bacterium]|nr:hypothetical protein [Candidatus Omnitrophota bacterium]